MLARNRACALFSTVLSQSSRDDLGRLQLHTGWTEGKHVTNGWNSSLAPVPVPS